MQWKDYRNNIIDLGFEEDDIFEESERHLIESTNRALIFLNSFLEGKTKVKHITLPASEEYQMIDVSKFEKFDSISHIPPKVQGKPVGIFYYEENVLYIKSSGDTLSITYKAQPELIPLDVEDNYEIDIKVELIPLLQLMTAYYVWLDDDERKAVYYYNQYQEMVNTYLSNKSKEDKTSVIATVEGGIDI